MEVEESPPSLEKPYENTGSVAVQTHLKKIARIMYAAGDHNNPLKKSVDFLYEMLCKIVNNLYDEEILTKVIKYQNPLISKKIKAKKMLKYLEKMFPIQACTYFTSVEIKVKFFFNKNIFFLEIFF